MDAMPFNDYLAFRDQVCSFLSERQMVSRKAQIQRLIAL